MNKLDNFNDVITLLTREKSEELLFPEELKAWQRMTEEERLKTREAKEEAGLELIPKNGQMILSGIVLDCLWDVWVFKQDFDLRDVVLQDGETIDAKKATRSEIEKMMREGLFVNLHFKNELDKIFE